MRWYRPCTTLRPKPLYPLPSSHHTPSSRSCCSCATRSLRRLTRREKFSSRPFSEGGNPETCRSSPAPSFACARPSVVSSATPPARHVFFGEKESKLSEVSDIALSRVFLNYWCNEEIAISMNDMLQSTQQSIVLRNSSFHCAVDP